MSKTDDFSFRQVEYDLPVPDLLTAFAVSAGDAANVVVWRVSVRGDAAVLVGMRARVRTPPAQQDSLVEDPDRVR